MSASLVGSEMCIRDRTLRALLSFRLPEGPQEFRWALHALERLFRPPGMWGARTPVNTESPPERCDFPSCVQLRAPRSRALDRSRP
eukprot:206423-Alexandrium_andersonii.AAC.1